MSAPNNQLLQGIVKGVPSGDSLIIFTPRKNAPPIEYLLSLSGLRAPRLATIRFNAPEDIGKEDRYAWNAREYLRKFALGKRVEFTVSNTLGNRSFGTCSVVENDNSRVDLHDYLVSSGWVKYNARESVYKTKVSKIDGYDEVKTEKILVFEDNHPLAAIQRQAQEQKVGMFSESGDPNFGIRRIVGFNYTGPQVMKKYQNIVCDALVERVRGANSLEIILLDTFIHLRARIAGIQIPYSQNSPLAPVSKFLTETRLLHQNVKVKLHKFFVNKDDSITFSVTVIHPKGSIVAELLTNGYATLDPRAAEIIPLKELESFRTLVSQAQKRRAGYWKTVAISTLKHSSTSESMRFGVVWGIISGESLDIAFPKIPQNHQISVSTMDRTNPSNWIIQRVHLSSIRSPRCNLRDSKKSQPWGFESRNALRKLLVGKPVQVRLDYTRPGVDNQPPRHYASVFVSQAISKNEAPVRPTGTISSSGRKRRAGNKTSSTSAFFKGSGPFNIGLYQVASGNATVVFHKAGDPQSPDYDALIVAETAAKKGGLGLHSKKASQATVSWSRIEDATATTTFYNNMKTSTWNLGYIDHIVGPNRFAVVHSISKSSFFLSLDGLWTPRKHIKNVEPANQSVAQLASSIFNCSMFYVHSLVYQRPILFSLTRLEKQTQLFGDIQFSLPSGATRSLSEELLTRGFAKMWIRSPPFDPLMIAQKVAKANKLGVWNLVEPYCGPDTTISKHPERDEPLSQESSQSAESQANQDSSHAIQSARLASGDRQMKEFFNAENTFFDSNGQEMTGVLDEISESSTSTTQNSLINIVKQIPASPAPTSVLPVMNPNSVLPTENIIVIVNNGKKSKHKQENHYNKGRDPRNRQNNRGNNRSRSNHAQQTRERKARKQRETTKAATLN